ncbi:MAG: hypothetical protein WC943_10975 [Elusimicrobiota bacterium]|jgi:hypothetical protein
MDQSLDDLRQALRKLRQDIEAQVKPGADEPSRPAPRLELEAGRSRPLPSVSVEDPVLEDDSSTEPPAPEVKAVPAEDEREPSWVQPVPLGRAEGDPAEGKAEAPARGLGLLWPKVLLAAGFGAAAVGAFSSSGAAMGAGLLLCMAGSLAGALSGPVSKHDDDGEVSDLKLRVAALERRTSAVNRASESGSLSAEVVEEVVELRRILTSLFKALEKPSEKP